MALRFAILKTINKEGAEEIALEYNDLILRRKLIAATKEQLVEKIGLFKRSFSVAEIEEAIDAAYTQVVNEFKLETVTLS